VLRLTNPDEPATWDAGSACAVVNAVASARKAGQVIEAAQEAFVPAWSKWPQISAYDDPRGWILPVAHRLALLADDHSPDVMSKPSRKERSA
jgi:predicted RNA polymerase sigma factor